MAPERHAEPGLSQALDTVQEELRAEQRALGTLPHERAGLRTRLEQLEAERAALHLELEALRQGRPTNTPRLPAILSAPFEVQARVSRLRLLREALPPLLMGAGFLSVKMNREVKLLLLAFVGMFLATMMVGRPLSTWLRRSRWRFQEKGIELRGDALPSGFLPYTDVLDAEVRVSPSQRRQGLGTVVVKRHSRREELVLKDVPEPERLVEWIRSQRSGVE